MEREEDYLPSDLLEDAPSQAPEKPERPMTEWEKKKAAEEWIKAPWGRLSDGTPKGFACK